MSNQLVGQTIERYQITRMLGEGGMGAVYLGHDITLQRDVAVKVMHPHFARMSDFRERFLQEARSAARMSHTGIVQVYDFGQQKDLLYIVMEFIPGSNLQEMLKELRQQNQWIRLDEAVGLLRQVALALDYAHRQGVLHRDIKPANIMLHPEPAEELSFHPVITDLGLARLAGGQGLTADGTSMGTPTYMSPEQTLGEKVDARSDVYSLGVLLYELCVGQLPFKISTLSEAIRCHTKEPPPPPRSIQPNLPVMLEKIILRCMAKSPDDRPPNAAELAKALLTIQPKVKDTATSTIAGNAVSLVTQYEKSIVEPRGPSILREIDQAGGTGPAVLQDSLRVMAPDATVRLVAFKAGGMIIGRDQTTDIPLADNKISRQHVRIEFDGASYRVTDLNSRNGTYLGNNKLLPGVAEVWQADAALRVGDTWLSLVRPAAPGSGMVAPGQGFAGQGLRQTPVVSAAYVVRSDGSRLERSQLRSSTGGGRVAVHIEPMQVPLEVDRPATLRILLLNQGSMVDHFHVSTQGVPNSWVKNLPPPLQLMPGQQQEATLMVQAPRSPESRAGRHALSVRVHSQNAPTEIVETAINLVVTPYSQFKSELHPERIYGGRNARLTVRNQGNARETYQLGWSDRGDDLIFKPQQARLDVPPGESASFEFSAVPKRRRLFGRDESCVFKTQVTSPAGETQQHSGELVSRGLIPAWAILLAFLLCALLTASLGWVGYSQYTATGKATQSALDRAATEVAAQMAVQNTQKARDLANQQTQQALQTADIQTQQALGQANAATQTQQALIDQQKNMDATSMAATAKAQGDDDGDGLSNNDEIKAGSNPQVADTDGDGLNDGMEIYQYGTSPIKLDSDGDTLTDGQEVEMGISPINQDTDGDGLFDQVDPDPRQPPTPTPAIPPGGISWNCDGTYQRLRIEDGGAQGYTISVDNWDGIQWATFWAFEVGDPMERQLLVQEAGLYKFGSCRQLLILPLRYSGSGTTLDLQVFGWTGFTVAPVMQLNGMTHGKWSVSGDTIKVQYSVYLFGEPNCCPCNTRTDSYTWQGQIFKSSGSTTNPTYTGDAPEECSVQPLPTLGIIPKIILTPLPLIPINP